MIRKSWLRKADRSPSHSPQKIYQQTNESLAMKHDENYSPIKLKKCGISPSKSPNGKIISPDKSNPFKMNIAYSPLKKFRLE